MKDGTEIKGRDKLFNGEFGWPLSLNGSIRSEPVENFVTMSNFCVADVASDRHCTRIVTITPGEDALVLDVAPEPEGSFIHIQKLIK